MPLVLPRSELPRLRKLVAGKNPLSISIGEVLRRYFLMQSAYFKYFLSLDHAKCFRGWLKFRFGDA